MAREVHLDKELRGSSVRIRLRRTTTFSAALITLVLFLPPTFQDAVWQEVIIALPFGIFFVFRSLLNHMSFATLAIATLGLAYVLVFLGTLAILAGRRAILRRRNRRIIQNHKINSNFLDYATRQDTLPTPS